MLPEFALINMNGRMYDPLLGRMLSPDNVIHDATGTQSYNRYSYVSNNPLKYTDPTGWDFEWPDQWFANFTGNNNSDVWQTNQDISNMMASMANVGYTPTSYTNTSNQLGENNPDGNNTASTNPSTTSSQGQSAPPNGTDGIINVLTGNNPNNSNNSDALDPNIVFAAIDANTSVPTYKNNVPDPDDGSVTKTVHEYVTIVEVFFAAPIEIAEKYGSQALKDAPALGDAAGAIGGIGTMVGILVVNNDLKSQNGVIYNYNVADIALIGIGLSPAGPYVGTVYFFSAVYTESKYDISPNQYLFPEQFFQSPPPNQNQLPPPPTQNQLLRPDF